jgi:acylpyruvate hydrolase
VRFCCVRGGDGAAHAALLDGDRAVAVSALCRAVGIPVIDADLMRRGWPDIERELRPLQESLHDTVERHGIPTHALTDLGAPVPRPGKIMCVGRNWAEHARETGGEVPEQPIIFAKYATAVVGPFDDVVRPVEVHDLDYEAELAVVIGSRCRRVSRHGALDVVAGYMCANDVSARTAQWSGTQWVRGKSFDTFCPLGPALVTRDEVPDPQALRIRCRVDDEVRQDSTTGLMLFDIPTLIEHVSAATTLEPGDVLLTGTPPGVAAGRDPAPWLQPGQVCEVDIEGVGRLRNRIVAEQPG